MSSETLKLHSKESSLPSTKNVLDLTNKLRDLINQNNPSLIEVPGQGTTWASDITFPDGSQRQLGWARIRDEQGALVWTDKGERLELGNYNVLYVDPYSSVVEITRIERDNKSPLKKCKVKCIDWAALCDIFSWPQQFEEA